MFKRYRPSLLKILPFVILAILAFTYRDVLRSMVLVPLAYLIYIFRLISGSLGQQALWISFIILSTIVAVISLAARRDEQTENPDVEFKYPTRLQTWANSLSLRDRSLYFKWNLAQDISNLLIEAIAYQQGISTEQVRFRLQSGNINLPQDIIEYLKLSSKPFSRTDLSQKKTNWFIKKWQNMISRSKPMMDHSPLDLEQEKIIGFLEEYLNIETEIWEV